MPMRYPRLLRRPGGTILVVLALAAAAWFALGQFTHDQPRAGTAPAAREQTAVMPNESPTHRRKPNHLIHEKSPYLLQHAYNPVDWYPWGREAFDRARGEEQPIFLSIGYSTCHWCHVMERESFENDSVAELLNRYYIAIKVDREERPDVDRVYMTAMQAMGMGGGWPLNVFLTPERQPLFGGTFFPPQSPPGRAGMRAPATPRFRGPRGGARSEPARPCDRDDRVATRRDGRGRHSRPPGRRVPPLQR